MSTVLDMSLVHQDLRWLKNTNMKSQLARKMHAAVCCSNDSTCSKSPAEATDFSRRWSIYLYWGLVTALCHIRVCQQLEKWKAKWPGTELTTFDLWVELRNRYTSAVIANCLTTVHVLLTTCEKQSSNNTGHTHSVVNNTQSVRAADSSHCWCWSQNCTALLDQRKLILFLDTKRFKTYLVAE